MLTDNNNKSINSLSLTIMLNKTKLPINYIYVTILILHFSCESSPIQKISAIRCIHEGFRFFLTAYRKDHFIETKNLSVMLYECFINLLNSDNLPMETLFNCCLSIVYSHIDDTSTLECWKVT